MEIAMYILMIGIAIAGIICGIIARKQIAKCEDEKEKKLVKERWQLICGLLGGACIIFAGILIFTMF